MLKFLGSTLRSTLSACFASVVLASNAAHADIPVAAAVLPPFIMEGEAKPGLAIDFINEVAKRTGLSLDTHYLPLARAQKYTQDTPQTLLLPPARTAAREDKFNWIAEFSHIEFAFISKDHEINSYEEGKTESQIAVIRDSAMMHVLKGQGFENLYLVDDVQQAQKMLDGGRVDAWFQEVMGLQYALSKAGIPASHFKRGATLLELPLWVASNKDLDPAIAAQIKAAVEEIIADGTRDAIVKSYTE